MYLLFLTDFAIKNVSDDNWTQQNQFINLCFREKKTVNVMVNEKCAVAIQNTAETNE